MSLLALIPFLETLPGWPAVQEPTLLDSFLVILGIPLAMALVFSVFFMGPHWARRAKNQNTAELERA